jgi:hypothetical protein
MFDAARQAAAAFCDARATSFAYTQDDSRRPLAAALGLGSDAIGIESRVRAAVDLFLNGAAARKRG